VGLILSLPRMAPLLRRHEVFVFSLCPFDSKAYLSFDEAHVPFSPRKSLPFLRPSPLSPMTLFPSLVFRFSRVIAIDFFFLSCETSSRHLQITFFHLTSPVSLLELSPRVASPSFPGWLTLFFPSENQGSFSLSSEPGLFLFLPDGSAGKCSIFFPLMR